MTIVTESLVTITSSIHGLVMFDSPGERLVLSGARHDNGCSVLAIDSDKTQKVDEFYRLLVPSEV